MINVVIRKNGKFYSRIWVSNLLKDTRVLESLGLIELEDVTTATGRAGQKPFASYDEIDVKIKGTTLEDVA